MPQAALTVKPAKRLKGHRLVVCMVEKVPMTWKRYREMLVASCQGKVGSTPALGPHALIAGFRLRLNGKEVPDENVDDGHRALPYA